MLFLVAFIVAAVLHADAMDYETSRREALFLTDKMAYELNLNEEQYEQAYQINFDYLMGLGSPADAYGIYLSRRNQDFRYILLDWQYSLFTAADYFFRPVTWRLGAWFLPIYSIYDTARFFFSKPACWISYRGGHSWAHNGGNSWFRGRRADWNGGFRGADFRGGNAPRGGRGYHIGSDRVNVPGRGMSGGHRGYTIGEPNRGMGGGNNNRGMGRNDNRSMGGGNNDRGMSNNNNRGTGSSNDNRGVVGSSRQSSTRSTVQGTVGRTHSEGGRSGSGFDSGSSRSRSVTGGIGGGSRSVTGGISSGGRSGGISGGIGGGGRSGGGNHGGGRR
jgi:hypothetical protein